MHIDHHHANNYLRYYNSQSGGRLDVFHGARRGQFGHGLGDILSGIFRTVLPIAAHGASTFLGEMANEQASGKSLKESALNALTPAAQDMVGTVSSRLRGSSGGRRKRKQTGAGGGGKRKKKYRKRRRHQRVGFCSGSHVQMGGGRGRKRRGRHQRRKGRSKQKRRWVRRSYKRRSSSTKSRSHKRNPIKFLNF